MSTTLFSETEAALRGAAEHPGAAVVGLGRGWGRGSGVIIAPGRVLTSAHNIRHDELTLTFANGEQRPGRVLATDPEADAAVIEADTGSTQPVGWDPQRSPVGIGTPVLALANPGGRGLRVTPGFVAAAPRPLRGPRGRRIPGAIEHTAPLPRGSSGGPLVDLEGGLLGINSVRVGGGLILAIPADQALHERVEALGRGEAPQRVRLGVAVAPPRVARRLRAAVGLPPADGVLVRGVQEDSPAGRAGIERGDLIVAAAGETIDSIDALYGVLDGAREASALELEILRGTDQRSLTVTLG